jgi:hypothetical protein
MCVCGGRLCGPGTVAGPETREARGGSPEARAWGAGRELIFAARIWLVIPLCQQFSTGLNDLRKEILRLNQAQGELVKADDFKGHTQPLWERLKELAREVRALQETEAAFERAKLVGELRRLREQGGAPEGQKPTSAVTRPSAAPATTASPPLP